MCTIDNGDSEVFEKWNNLNVNISGKSLFLLALEDKDFELARYIVVNKLKGNCSSNEIRNRYNEMGLVFLFKIQKHKNDAKLIFNGMFDRVRRSVEGNKVVFDLYVQQDGIAGLA